MSPDTPDVMPPNAPADASVPESAPAPKRPRAPRKTAAADGAAEPPAAASADGEADPAPAPRKRARKAVEAVEAEASAVEGSDPVPAAAEPADAAAPRPARAPRAPRARAPGSDNAVTAAPADHALPVEHREDDAHDARPAAAAEPPVSGGDEGGAGDDGAPGGADGEVDGASSGDGGRRSRSRRRRRGRRGGDEIAAGAEGEDAGGAAAEGGEGRAERPVREERPPRPIGPPVEFATADVCDTFAGVVAGDFDDEPDAAEGGLPPIPAKRVLAAEPDAPKLHKVLAQSGIGSRRDMEQLITDGKVTVNGEVAHTGQRISFGDEVRVQGRVVKLRIAPPPARVIAYHKPAGEVVTMDDPEKRPTVFRRLPRLAHGKWQSVGRLDINTEGLLLFTNSGDLANKLMHPRFGVEREYAVRVLGTLDDEARQKLLDGVVLDGQPAQFKSIEDGGGEGANRWYRVVITEGRNREVRKLFDAVGMAVSRLIRIRYGSVVLPKGLRRAVWVDLDENDVRRLRQLAGGGDNGPPQRDRERDGAPAPQAGQPPRDSGQQRGNNNGQRNDRNDRNARGNNGGNSHGGGQQQLPKGRRGRDRDRPRQDNAGSPAPFREPGDPSFIPNPLQQTFDRRAIQQRERPVVVDYDDDSDGPIGPIPNPLQQTYDKRAVSGNRNAFGKGGGARKGGGAGGGGQGGKQPDPLQTAVGYIGADTFIKKLNNRGGGGRGRR